MDDNTDKRRRRPTGWMVGLIILACVILSALWLRHYLLFVSTDDAYIDGTIVPVSAEIKGKVGRVFITDNQLVRAGQPLLEIEPDDYLYAVRQNREAIAGGRDSVAGTEADIKAREMSLRQAQAALEAAAAREDLALKEKERYRKLLREEATTRQKYDQVESSEKVTAAGLREAQEAVAAARAGINAQEAQLKAGQARVRESEATLALAGLNLKRTVVKAPMDGRIAQKAVDPGKYVQAGQPLLAVVSAKNIWVTANFKETQLKRMKIGQPVSIKVDAYSGLEFKGHVQSFQPGTGSVFSLLPPENATGNFVKIVQRIPAKIMIDSPADPAHPLWPGLSVVPVVDTRRK